MPQTSTKTVELPRTQLDLDVVLLELLLQQAALGAVVPVLEQAVGDAGETLQWELLQARKGQPYVRAS